MPHGRPSRLAALSVATILTVLLACGEDAGGSAATRGAPASAGTRPRVIRPPYREAAVANGGRVSGTVAIEGSVPPDSMVRLSGDTALECGATLPVRTIDARGGRVTGAIVWIEGLRSGKPLPLERRYSLEHQGCLLVPRAQTAVVGGTLNVVNDDAIAHVTEVKSPRASAPLATLRFSFEGQVVPLDRALAESGRLEIACTLHPWAKAWVQVFDHPYFATTSADGSFTIDSVPPGRYAIVAWQERLGEMRDSVTVPANGEVKVALRGRVK